MDDVTEPDAPKISRPARPPGNTFLLNVGNAFALAGSIAGLLHYRLVSLGLSLLALPIMATMIVRKLLWSRRAR